MKETIPGFSSIRISSVHFLHCFIQIQKSLLSTHWDAKNGAWGHVCRGEVGLRWDGSDVVHPQGRWGSGPVKDAHSVLCQKMIRLFTPFVAWLSVRNCWLRVLLLWITLNLINLGTAHKIRSLIWSQHDWVMTLVLFCTEVWNVTLVAFGVSRRPVWIYASPSAVHSLIP